MSPVRNFKKKLISCSMEDKISNGAKLRNRYFILRHGETIYQTKKKKNIYPPPEKQSSIKLTKKGEAQIKKGAKLLSEEDIDLIFASDIFRTRQTAKIVARELGLKIKLDSRLRDVNLGIYHGRLKKEFYQDFPLRSLKRFYKRPIGGESWAECRKRMISFLKDVDRKHKGKKILLVSHGDPLWLLEGTIKGWSVKDFLRTAKVRHIKTGELRELITGN